MQDYAKTMLVMRLVVFALGLHHPCYAFSGICPGSSSALKLDHSDKACHLPLKINLANLFVQFVSAAETEDLGTLMVNGQH